MWSRFLPHYDVIAQALQDGLIGEVTTVFADHGQHLYPGGPERLSSPDLAGGALLDLAVYPISFADFVLGPFASITATGTLTDRGVDSQETVTVTSATGALGVLHASMLAASACTASICGTEGRLDIGGTFYFPTWVRLHDRNGDVIDRHDPVADVAHQGLRYEAAEAARCLTAGAPNRPLLPLGHHGADHGGHGHRPRPARGPLPRRVSGVSRAVRPGPIDRPCTTRELDQRSSRLRISRSCRRTSSRFQRRCPEGRTSVGVSCPRSA